jgi:hypothetical protein
MTARDSKGRFVPTRFHAAPDPRDAAAWGKPRSHRSSVILGACLVIAILAFALLAR